ncbi:Uma2 family endonuclease [Fodinisporobacter ferrooxydans]|uniref:Uma2 family endonuclease n=1 Tax=Fodinisporobacter ferrooxydans TaxID=2901836 RepID=A0ABY4CPK5_9BACL|nr:Uma2 family endonuclease [Alicyclobacillaceae bacterium MYW30-H2]
MSLHDPRKRYTYQDYLNWTMEERYELIDGIPYSMSPAPSPRHQDIVRELLTEFTLFLRNTSCKVYSAPLDVRLLSEDKADDQVSNVVQPDLTVICDSSKIDHRGCNGSPDLLIEILSPSTHRMDKLIKYRLYEQAKVKEYWIIDPVNETVEIHTLNDGQRYQIQNVYTKEDVFAVAVGMFEGFVIDLKAIFI